MISLAAPRNTTQWVIPGTITFRLASRGWFNKRWGTNLQNIEKDARRMYVPDEGKIFVQTDQSGAEALIVAYLCKHGLFRDLFLHGIKPHVFVALHLFKDVWKSKIKSSGLDIKCDIDELCRISIDQLHLYPFWNQVDKLIKSSDNWPPEHRYYYIAKQICHCVDDETKVLTKKGWLNSSSIDKDEAIMIWDSNKNQLNFEIPKEWFKYKLENSEMYHFCGDEIDQLVTPEHSMVHFSNDKYLPTMAKYLYKLADPRIPNSSYFIGGIKSLKDCDIRLLVAIQADGYIFGNNRVRFRLKKQRKINRLKFLLNCGGYLYEKRQTDVTEFYIDGLEHLIKLFGKEKLWGNWLLEYDLKTLTILIGELKHWDGTFEESYLHKRESYSTKHFKNAKWIKTICHLIGKQGTLNRNSDIYEVGINNRQKGRIKDRAKINNYSGSVYCPSTTTGFFLIKRHGKISITGNSSNYGVKAGMFCLNTLEKSRGKIVIKEKQAREYLSFYHGLFTEIKEWHQDVQQQVESTRILYNLQGFPRYFGGEINERSLKEAYAFIPQSTVGTITNIAYTKLQSFIEKSRLMWDMLANTHDSYLSQCPIDEALECAKMQKLLIEQDLISPRGEPFKMRSETVAGYNWAPYKEGKNDNGLKEVKL